MNREELKKKIKEILRKRMTELLGSCHTDEIPLTEEGAEAILFYADEFADALIAAWIGDVSELQKECDSKEEAYNRCYFYYKYWKDKAKAEHRAERAERAFSKLVHEMYEHGIRPMCDEKFFVESRLKDAEKELAEEGEND